MNLTAKASKVTIAAALAGAGIITAAGIAFSAVGASASTDLPARSGSSSVQLSDDRGTHAEPGDDRGTHAEFGDDRGTHAEPGDDKGMHAEPGDDRGHHAEPGDDKGGDR